MARIYSDKEMKRRAALEAAKKKKTEPAPEEKSGELDRVRLLETLIPLSEDEREKLGEWVHDRIEQSLNSQERRLALDRLRMNRKHYEEGVPRDDKPFDNAHDVRLKWGAGQCDTISVRLSQGLFGLDPIFQAEGRNLQSLSKAPKLTRFVDWWCDEFWQLGDRGPLITDNAVRDGHVVLFQPWRLEIDRGKVRQVEQQMFRDAITGKSVWVNVDSETDIIDALTNGLRPVDEFRVIDKKIDRVVMNGPDLEEHSLEDYIWPPWVVPGTTSKRQQYIPYEGVRQWFSLDELWEMDREGEMYEGVYDKLKTSATQPLSGIEKLEQGDRAQSQHKPLGEEPLDASLGFWLVYIDYKLPKSKRLEKLEVLYHFEKQEVVFARHYGYEHGESPFDHLRFVEVPWRFDGISAMELYRSIEQIVQNLINYEIDDTYMKAAMQFKYRKSRFNPANDPLAPWKGIGLKSLADFEPLHLPDRRAVDMNLLAQLIQFGERRVQIGPYQQGQESPNNQRPTARGIFMLLEQAKQLFDKAVRGQLRTWRNVVRKQVLLWQQMSPEYIAIDAVGRDGAPLFPAGMGRRDLIGKFNFEMTGNVDAVLHELNLEMNMQIYELLKEHPFIRTSVSAYYDLTEDLINSFRKKRKILPPKAEVQKRMGLKPSEALLTPQEERILVADMKARGIKDDEIYKRIEELKSIKLDEPAGGGVMPPPGTPPTGAPGLPWQAPGAPGIEPSAPDVSGPGNEALLSGAA